ncbi:MAG: signal peptidase II [Chloroflexi bacterium]|nr:signal peptidase II [Chloroflexota bacterium]
MIIGLLVFTADQITKTLVRGQMLPYQSIFPFPQINSFLSVTYVQNTGAAFGILQERGLIFVIIAVVVITAIFAYYKHLPTEYLAVRLSLGLQLGGALGNLMDRLRFGFVTDFLDLGWWPIFNLADAAIVIGVITLAIYMLREDRKVVTTPTSVGQDKAQF